MFLLPLVSTLTSSVFSGSMIARYLGHRGCVVISIFCLFVSFISSVLIWFEVCFGSSEVYIDLFGPWFTVGSFNVSWTVYIDLYTAHMLLTVTSVSTAVHCYAVVYMRSDPHLNLFMSYLSLFTFFMLVLVCSESLINMLVGWEGINVRQCPNSAYSYMYVTPTHLMDYIIKTSCSVFLEVINTNICPFGSDFDLIYFWFFPNLPADSRKGYHTPLFFQVLTGGRMTKSFHDLTSLNPLLGDGNLECHGRGARLAITFKSSYEDVANWYNTIFYGLGYNNNLELGQPLVRTSTKASSGVLSYYQVRTFTFASFVSIYHSWYVNRKKVIPQNIEEYLTPLALVKSLCD